MSLLEIKDAIKFLDSLRAPALCEAKALFPNHPKAQDVWVKLCSRSGGIEPTVDTLGLTREYRQYQHDFRESIEKGCNEVATMLLNDFVEFYKDQVRENFYLFK